MMTSRNARLALFVALLVAAFVLHAPLLVLALLRLASALVLVVSLFPWRRCSQCRALVTRRYRVERTDGSVERLCEDCGVQYAELIESQ
jgi:hypothetical protein